MEKNNSQNEVLVSDLIFLNTNSLNQNDQIASSCESCDNCDCADPGTGSENCGCEDF